MRSRVPAKNKNPTQRMWGITILRRSKADRQTDSRKMFILRGRQTDRQTEGQMSNVERQMSNVKRQMSHVKCQMPNVKCQMSGAFKHARPQNGPADFECLVVCMIAA